MPLPTPLARCGAVPRRLGSRLIRLVPVFLMRPWFYLVYYEHVEQVVASAHEDALARLAIILNSDEPTA